VQASSDVPSGGKGKSLEVTNRSRKPLDYTTLTGDEVPATGGEIYTFSAKVKYRNVTWTRVVMEGYKADTAEWVPMADCPSMRSGTWHWTDYACSFDTPPGITKIRPVLYAGWVNKARKGAALSFFDDVKISRVSEDLYSTLSDTKAPATDSTRLNPQKYTVRVTGAAKPFVLVFGEAFDPMWVARVGGKEIDGVPLYSTITGFPIDKTGTFEVTIEYRAQKWFVQGLVVAVSALALCLLYILIVIAMHLLRRKRTDGKPAEN
jgi:hypothetical protein